MTRTFILVGGAGEKPNQSQLLYQMLKNSGVLRPSDIFSFVNYPASIGPVNLTPDPFDFKENATQSVREGVRQLQKQGFNVSEADEVYVFGYSLGAWVVNNWLEMLARGGAIIPQLKGVFTVGSPKRTVITSGGGIAGSHALYPRTVKHYEISNWNDIVSNTPPRSPLRALPFVEQVVTTGQVDGVRKGWADVAQLFLMGQLRFIDQRDITLLTKYADHTGHEREYLAQWAYNVLRGVLA